MAKYLVLELHPGTMRPTGNTFSSEADSAAEVEVEGWQHYRVELMLEGESEAQAFEDLTEEDSQGMTWFKSDRLEPLFPIQSAYSNEEATDDVE